MEKTAEIKRSVFATKELRAYLRELFKVTERTVAKALTEWSDEGRCPRIRKAALEKGGYVQLLLPEVETIHDRDGRMIQRFPNGVELVIDKRTGEAHASDRKGREVGHWTALDIPALSKIQEQLYARA